MGIECGDLNIITSWVIGSVCFAFGVFITAVVSMARGN